jgi:hypothetical protein
MAMHVYKLGEETYYAARSVEEARAEYVKDVGKAPDQEVELSEEALDRMTVAIADEDEKPTGEVMTFRQFLDAETGGVDGEAFFFCGEQ